MNRKPLLALFGISIVAVFSLTFFASVCENTPIVPDVMATTNKSFTFDEISFSSKPETLSALW